MNGFKECSSCEALYTKSYFLNTSESYNDDSNVVYMLQEPIVFNQDPGENSSQSPSQIDHHCCYGCDDSLDGIFCQRCTCKSCGKGAHYGHNCPQKVLIISNPEPCHDHNVDEFPQTLTSFHPTCYSGDENSFAYDSTPNFVNDSLKIFNPPPQPPKYSYEFCENDAQYGHDCPPQVSFICDLEPFDNFQPSQPVIDHLNLQQRINDFMIELRGTFQAWLQQQKDQVCQKIPLCYDDDDDEESSTPLRDIIISELPLCISITPVLSTKDSLIMRDEHLDTIPEKESDEFIKSSVKNLVLNPSESEDEREYDVPACDNFTTFSNLLFDANDDFSSSDNESFFDEDILKEIYSNPLFDEKIISIKIDLHYLNAESDLIKSLLNQDSSIISSSKIDSILDEFAGELIFSNQFHRELMKPTVILRKKFILPRNCWDILILEELLSNDSLSLPENESFHFDIPPSPRPPAKPPDDDDDIKPNSKILTVKVVGDISEHYVVCLYFCPPNPPLLQIMRNLLISYRIGALKLFSFILKAR
uniref:Uncharacterized protein n=1 Tax=Tanacetum cinerariifolium TaxID=118510 RepID=A0A699JZU3_TANCI|nr:hypothetical protein [Tanacetum cinerariifolium]